MKQTLMVVGLFFSLMAISFSCNPKVNKTVGVSDTINQSQDEIFRLLTDDSVKYWDGSPQARGWYFNSDSIFIEYSYEESVRRGRGYGDIIWEDDFKFTISKDTLKILNYNDYQFLILKLTEDSLVVLDISEIQYTADTLSFIKSPDQQTELIIPPLLSW